MGGHLADSESKAPIEVYLVETQIWRVHSEAQPACEITWHIVRFNVWAEDRDDKLTTVLFFIAMCLDPGKTSAHRPSEVLLPAYV